MKCGFPRACVLVLLLGVASFPSRSEGVRLDDRGTFSVPAVPVMQWQSWKGNGGRSLMSGQFDLHLKLNVSSWVGRKVRLYLTLVRDQDSTLDMAWGPGGTFQGGQVTSGHRALVFSGAIGAPLIEESLRVQIVSEPDWHGVNRRLEVHFELEEI